MSIIVEWANTLLNGVPRAQVLLDILRVQWEAMAARDYPSDLPADAARYLDTLDETLYRSDVDLYRRHFEPHCVLVTRESSPPSCGNGSVVTRSA